MKAPDIVESWKWQPGESIIERLLAISSRVVGVPIPTPAVRPTKDRYYRLARRWCAIQAAREAMKG